MKLAAPAVSSPLICAYHQRLRHHGSIRRKTSPRMSFKGMDRHSHPLALEARIKRGINSLAPTSPVGLIALQNAVVSVAYTRCNGSPIGRGRANSLTFDLPMLPTTSDSGALSGQHLSELVRVRAAF